MLTIGIEDNIVVAALSGEVDLANAGDIGAEISAQVPNAALGLVVDLTDVAYLDSSGIRVLFELAERLQSRQQAMRLVAPGHSQTTTTSAHHRTAWHRRRSHPASA